MSDPSTPVETPAATPPPSTAGRDAAAGTPESAPATPEPNPEVARLQAEVQKAQAESEAAKRYVVQLVTQWQEATKAPPPDPAKETAEFRELLDTDPRRALDLAFEERMRPLLQETVGLQAQAEKKATEMRFAAADEYTRREWDRYRPEVEQFMAPMPLDVQAKPGAWEEAFKFVRMNHFDEVVTARLQQNAEAEKASALERATGRAPSRAPVGLNAEEKRMATAFGMTEADWLKHRQAIETSERGAA